MTEMFTKEEVARRHAEKAANLEKERQERQFASEDAIAQLPRDERGVPYVAVPLDDPDAWRVIIFWSQHRRNAGDLRARVRLAHIALGAELGYWKNDAAQPKKGI